MNVTQLNFHHLRYFWAVARDGNLTHVAKGLRVSQSALSSQIHQLEEQLGFALFERRGRQLVLTEPGKMVLAYAEEIFAAGAQLVATLERGRQAEQPVRIGAVASFFLVGAVCSTDEACQALSERLGYPVQTGLVELEEMYHQVCAHVAVGGRTALRLRLMDRRVLPGTRLGLSSFVTLARRGGTTSLLHLPVQADWGAVDGGRQVLDAFNPEAFGAGQAFRPAFPMSAAFGACELTLAAPDATIDPQTPAEESLAAV